MFQSQSGRDARSAVELYAQSVFCLQPPGDTLPRTGIVDAISVGCIPVIFHPGQAQLWPLHWNASASAVLVDWQSDATHEQPNARRVLQQLLEMPEPRVAALQAAVRDAAVRVHYRGDVENADHGTRDAVDVLVTEGLLPDAEVQKDLMRWAQARRGPEAGLAGALR